MAQVIFNRPSQERSAKELSFQVEDQSEKIRAQGLSILRGWEKKSQYDKEQSREVLNALKENANIEEQYRAQAFDAHLKDNQRVRDNILHNYGVEVKNANQQADNALRKYSALAELTTAVPEVIKQGQRLRKEAATKRMEKEWNRTDTPEKEPKSPEVEEVLKKERTEKEQARFDADTKGMPAHIKQGWAGYSRLEKEALKDIHAFESAKQGLLRFNSTKNEETGHLKVYTTPGGEKVSLHQARELINTLPGEQKYVQQGKLFHQSNQAYAQFIEETYGIKGDRYHKFFRPGLAKDHDAWVRSTDKRDQSKAEKSQYSEAYKINVLAPYNDAVRGLTSSGQQMSPSQAIAHARTVFMSRSIKGQTPRQRQRLWNSYIIAGVKAGHITPHVAKAYVKNTQVEPFQWKDKNAKLRSQEKPVLTQSIQKAFPKDAAAVLEAVEAVEIETAKAAAAEVQRIKNIENINFERTIVEMEEAIQQNPNLTISDIRKMFITGRDSVSKERGYSARLKNRLQKYTKENNLTVRQQNAIDVNDDFERLLEAGEMTNEWISSQPVLPGFKTQLYQRFESAAGVGIYKAIAVANSHIDGRLKPWMRGRNQEAHIPIDSRWLRKLNMAKKVIRKEAMQLYPTFHVGDVTRDEAIGKAFSVATENYLERMDWKGRNNSGNYWAKARPGARDIANVSQPENYEIIRDPVEIMGDDLRQAGNWSSWLNDGRAPENINVMQLDILNLKKSMEKNEPWKPSVYTQRSADLLGMTPEKFVFLNAEKFDINDDDTPSPTDAKFNLKWEDSVFGKAEKALDDLSPSIRRLWPDQLPDKAATETVFAYQVLDQLGIGYGDVETLLQNPDLEHLVSDSVKTILQRRGITIETPTKTEPDDLFERLEQERDDSRRKRVTTESTEVEEDKPSGLAKRTEENISRRLGYKDSDEMNSTLDMLRSIKAKGDSEGWSKEEDE